MKKDFESRFMPSCKFSIMGKNREIFNSLDIPLIHNYIRTSISGEIAALCDYQTWFEGWEEKEVSIYEAIPELIPDGMRYNKELDKLVPDVISVSKEYCSGINIESDNKNLNDNVLIMTLDEKNYKNNKVFRGKTFGEVKEEILQRENGFIKADKKKINFSLVDPYAYEDLGKCLTIGAEKYDSDNWKLGDIESYISALDRHLLDIKKAVADKDKSLFIDKDTALQHGANLLCNAMFLHYFIRKELEEK